MKKNIHPEYHFIKVILSDKSNYVTRSTYGEPYSVLKLTTDRLNHPAWTKGNFATHKDGRAYSFRNKFKGFDDI